MIILEFNENFEARIKTQFPPNFSSSFNLKASDLMNIYTLHRMDKNEPNFFQMEIKEFSAGSFFTGFSLKHYVGRPNYAITAFFSNEENNTEQSQIDFNFEGMLRRIVYELLPKIEDKNKDDLLKEYYIKLENKELEPFWEEYNEDEISQLIALPSEIPIETEVNNKTPEKEVNTKTNIHSDDEIKELEYYKLENETLKAEIESLEMLLLEKVTEDTDKEDIYNDSTLEEWKSKYEKLEEYNQILSENVDKLKEMSNKYQEEVKKKTKDLNELKNRLDSKDTLIDELNKKIEKISKQLEEYKRNKDDALEYYQVIEVLKKESNILTQDNERLKKDNDIHLETIADLKLKLRELKDKFSSEEALQNTIKDEIIDLKKDIKVLRRERDHYKSIIKEHNLL